MGSSSSSSSGSYVAPSCVPVDSSQKVIEIRVQSCWLGNDFWSSIGSKLTVNSTGSSLSHWWVEIKTNYGWYCAQLGDKGVYLHKHSSRTEVDKCGLSFGSNDSNGTITTLKTHSPSNRNMGEVRDWVKNSNNYYHLVKHNCQHWAREFYNWI